MVRSGVSSLPLLAAGGLALLAFLAGGSAAAKLAAPSLPDMRIYVPVDKISIGTTGGHRELHFTHKTADVGPGPFEIDPHYDSSSGVSSFSQTLYRPNGSGGWAVAKRVPLAAFGTWEPPSDYRYPLTSFTLNKVAAGGALGAVVARSPKVDYCITGDTTIPRIAHTPGETFIPDSNCGDPTLPLGWSVGWADEYDEADAGQPISLSGVPNGTYILRATVDPEHVLRETTTADDVTDTTLRINGDQVTVLFQKVVKVALPTARLTGLTAQQAIYGSIDLKAAATAPTGRSVKSVQFLLDGRPLGPALTSAPYSYPWTISAQPGTHELSARVTDSLGVMGSAPVVPVVVRSTPLVQVTRLGWSAGYVHLRIGTPPAGDSVVAVIPTLGNKRITVRNGALDVKCPRPSRIVLELVRGGKTIGKLVLPLDAVPAVSILNPGHAEIVSGIVPLAAAASDSVGVTSVQYFLDGKRLSPLLRKSPYAWHWDTRGLKNGSHVLSAHALNAEGHTASAQVTVHVSNPAPAMTCFVEDKHVHAQGASPVATTQFRTSAAGETLLAFVSADGPQGSRQSATVSGGGLQWQLVARADKSPGDAEIWEAIARQQTNVSAITATLTSPGYDELLSVVAYEGADGVGASATGAGTSGAPSIELTTLSATSLVFAVGNDWDAAVARGFPVGWTKLDEWENNATGDTYWSQHLDKATGKAGSHIAVRDTSPTSDHWNLAAVELVNDGG